MFAEIEFADSDSDDRENEIRDEHPPYAREIAAADFRLVHIEISRQHHEQRHADMSESLKHSHREHQRVIHRRMVEVGINEEMSPDDAHDSHHAHYVEARDAVCRLTCHMFCLAARRHTHIDGTVIPHVTRIIHRSNPLTLVCKSTRSYNFPVWAISFFRRNLVISLNPASNRRLLL